MQFSSNFALVLALLSPLVDRSAAQDLMAMPQCGLECTVQSIGNTTCAATDMPCMCLDTVFTEATAACVTSHCGVLDALEVARWQADTCNHPRRSRKNDMYLPLVIGIPAWLFPWLRMYSSWTTIRTFKVDDWLMFACGIIYSGFLVLGQYMGQRCFGIDTWYMEEGEITLALKLFYMCQIVYYCCLALTKIAILCFYLRIFPQKLFKRLAYASIALIILATLTFITLGVIQCRPIRFAWEYWKEPNEEYSCFNFVVLVYCSASMNILQDLIVLILPLPWLWQLNLRTKSKFGVLFMFSLGIFVLVTSTVRLRYIIKLSQTTNPMWDYTDPILWSGLEVAVSVAVACLPAVRVLLHKLLPQLWSNIASKATRSKAGYIEEVSRHSLDAAQGRSGERFFTDRSISKDVDGESQIELGIQLGDKSQGLVRTEIYGARHHSASGSEEGIRIDTVTTQVHGRHSRS